MITNSFNPAVVLATASCPRCHTTGLTEIDSDSYDAAPPDHRHQATYMIDPSVPARCLACGLVMEWPGCCD